jgi:hypothetical protein
METLHMHGAAHDDGSRRGELMGALSSLLLASLPDGHLLVDVPVETRDGTCRVDLAWISNTRRSTLSRDPAYSGSPEICIHLPSSKTGENEVHKAIRRLFKVGAVENWICDPDGKIKVMRSHANDPGRMVPAMPEKIELD